MKDIIIIRPNNSQSCKDYNLSNFNILYIEYNSDIVSQRNENLFWHNHLEENINKLNHSCIVIIDRCNSVSNAVRIVSHLRLTSNLRFSKKPIIWVNSENFITFISEINEMNALLNPINNLYYLNEDDFSPESLSVEIERISKIINAENVLSELEILTPETSHQITNEWGAYILAKIAGFEETAVNISEKNSKYTDLYFKYLNHKYLFNITEQSLIFEKIPKDGKFLLIDDNHNKGWNILLKKLLENNFQSASLEILESPTVYSVKDNSSWQTVDAKIDAIKPNIIFLDLRLLTEEDDERYYHTPIDEFSGAMILKEIKDNYPDISVIMFTASNKAWNMQKLIDLGADGYFIKPSPEIETNSDILQEELIEFVELIKDSHKKHEELTLFWKYIETINNNSTLIEERTTTKVEERIRERLMMFFGLLKRDYEDSNFNKKFYYSDIELAFMTLWSCLNDIQFIMLSKSSNKKTIKIIQQLIDTYSINPEYQYVTKEEDNSIKTRIKENWNTRTFEIKPSWENTGLKNGSIGNQIAQLIIGLCSDNTIRDSFLKNLFELKDKRNKLYLTHGDEIGDFFEKTEREKEDITLKDCAELFEIVYFLLKAEYIKIDTTIFQ
jgi:CheY-like chemotaxis protein